MVLATLASLHGLAWPLAPGAADADPLAIGRRIYREGVLPNGQPLRGAGPAGVMLAGAQAACVTCHRRSGYGSSEGPIEVRAITGPSLFGERPAPPAPAVAPAVTTAQIGVSAAEAARAKAIALRSARAEAFAGARQRPPYDDASVARAVLEGLDVTGRRMHASMPRYGLEPDAMASLAAYLKALSAQVSPGVTEDTVHFATVIQPGTDPAQRQALLDVLQAFMQDRNQSQRVEVRREQAGQVHLRRVYRQWVLHVWDLSGPGESWGRQLEAYNTSQPAFALISGLGSESWRPIHEFSERFELPCIFPQSDVPVLAEHDFYTVYLSRGMTLEAQALARFLKIEGGRGPVIQVYRSDAASAAAAQAFRVAWAAGAGAAPADIVLEGSHGAAFWHRLAEQNPAATLVLWLPSRDLGGAQALSAVGSKVKAIYLSSSLNPGPRSGLAADGEGRVRLVYPQDLPVAREPRIEVVRRWLRNKGITPADEKVQLNAYLAATVTGMLMMHGKDTYSREFLLERMEHRLGTAIEASIYPHLSLGPGQRYASKGSYIMRVGGAEERQLTPLSDWIVP
jgi:hypothetical protein